jgi:predicted peptidase
MKQRLSILFFLLTIFTLKTNAQEFTDYTAGNFINETDTIFYKILFPKNFDPQQKYPILFMLHGAGERGNDNRSQLIHGGDLFLKDEIRKQFPSIIVFPQCPVDDYWANVKKDSVDGKRVFHFQKGGKPTKVMHALLAMIADLLEKPYVNKNQVYAGGLSMGGMGTFELLRRKPKLFAAAFTICGGDNIANVRKYKKIPLWIFHGQKDDVVDPVFSKEIANHLKIIGKEVRYTTYPEANHNSWDSAFAEPQLLPWLYAHSK